MTTVNLKTDVRNGKNGIRVIDFDGEVNGFAEDTLMEADQQARQDDTMSPAHGVLRSGVPSELKRSGLTAA